MFLIWKIMLLIFEYLSFNCLSKLKQLLYFQVTIVCSVLETGPGLTSAEFRNSSVPVGRRQVDVTFRYIILLPVYYYNFPSTPWFSVQLTHPRVTSVLLLTVGGVLPRIPLVCSWVWEHVQTSKYFLNHWNTLWTN